MRKYLMVTRTANLPQKPLWYNPQNLLTKSVPGKTFCYVATKEDQEQGGPYETFSLHPGGSGIRFFLH